MPEIQTESTAAAPREWKPGKRQAALIALLRHPGWYLRRYPNEGGVMKNWLRNPDVRGPASGNYTDRFIQNLVRRGVLVRVEDDTPPEMRGKSGAYVLASAYAAPVE